MATKKTSSQTADFVFIGIIAAILILFASYESNNNKINFANNTEAPQYPISVNAGL